MKTREGKEGGREGGRGKGGGRERGPTYFGHPPHRELGIPPCREMSKNVVYRLRMPERDLREGGREGGRKRRDETFEPLREESVCILFSKGGGGREEGREVVTYLSKAHHHPPESSSPWPRPSKQARPWKSLQPAD